MATDLYAKENEPKSKQSATLYHVNVPHLVNARDPKLSFGVTVRVYEDGLVNLDRFVWFGETGPRQGNYLDQLSTTNEIWEWLREWGFVKLVPIGPEDSEYFATSKLTGDEEDDKRYSDYH